MFARAQFFVVLVAATAVLAVGTSNPAFAQQPADSGAFAAAALQPADASAGGGGGSAESAAAAAAPAAAPAPEPAIQVKLGGKETLTIKGFLSATLFAQDANFGFGNGQNAQWPTSAYTSNKWFNGGDARNSRLTLAFDGPQTADGWKMGALVEGDFFGGYNGTGAFSQQQDVPRLRLAYADLTHGGTTIRIGQFWSPFFAEVPESLSHIAFPLGYGSAGVVGWRFPGVFLYQSLTPKGAKTKIQLDIAAFEGSWNAPSTGTLTNQTAGSVGFRGQFEAKLNFSGKDSAGNAWKFYLAGHYDAKDLNGVANAVPSPPHGVNSLTGTGAELGGSYKIGAFLIHGNLYTTKAAGQQFAAITQFGDIKDTGGWLQLGYDITKRWSAFAFYGAVDADRDDVLLWVGTGGMTKNQQSAVMLEWSLGQYQLGLEWLHDEATLGTRATLTGNQIALSTRFVF